MKSITLSTKRPWKGLHPIPENQPVYTCRSMWHTKVDLKASVAWHRSVTTHMWLHEYYMHGI